MSDDQALCGQCGSDLTNGGTVQRARGWCSGCGFFFDKWGMRILDPTVRCRVHTKEILGSCPHSGTLDRVDEDGRYLGPPAPEDDDDDDYL